MGYDKDGHTVYTKSGNGTENTYTYDKQRERLQEMNLTAAGTVIMTNKYQYDAVDNILGITDAGGSSNIEFVRAGREHLERHHGDYRNLTSGPKINEISKNNER